MPAVPAETPVTVPKLISTVALAVLLLVHVPPVILSVNTTDKPWQMANEGIIEGNAFMLTVVIAKQGPMLYVIIAVPPLTPVTRPVPELTVATAVLPLLQVPPVTPSDTVSVAPAHITEALAVTVPGVHIAVIITMPLP